MSASDRKFRLPYELIHTTEIAAIREAIRSGVRDIELRDLIGQILESIAERGDESFGCIVFQTTDIAGLVASRNGLESWSPGSVVALQAAGLTIADAERILTLADERMRDAMIETGWRVLGDVLDEALGTARKR